MNTNAITEENIVTATCQNEHECTLCKKHFRTIRGLNQHLRKNQHQQTGSKPADDVQKPPDPPPITCSENDFEQPLYKWGNYGDKVFEKNLSDAYEQIVYWRKNLFMLPTGKAGKRYINETTRLMNAWTEESPLQKVAFKAIMVMPSLLLQKPSKNSKSRDHIAALERRLLLWHSGEILDLLKEAQTIQDGISFQNKPKTIGETSKRFAEFMQKGNINGAMKILTNNMQNGILPLDDKTINLLQQKHPSSAKASEEVLLPDEPELLHPIKFENINVEAVRKAVLKTKGGSGPSVMDADGWRKLFVGNAYGESSIDLCNAFSKVIQKLCTVSNLHHTLDAFLACRLIPLNKNPGLRPIGVGEILRRIAGKTVVSVIREDILKSVGSLQVCAGHDAGCEAAVHAMQRIFNEEDTEAVLLIDASNAFNSLNRNVFLHNVTVVCPTISTYVKNCYMNSSRLFIIGGHKITSSEGTTQGDPIAMAIYAIAVIPLMLMILEITNKLPDNRTKIAAYADDFSAGGSVENLHHWWKVLCQLGPKFGYFPEASKCWLIVKPEAYDKATSAFKDTDIKITVEGKRHLGAIIGSSEYKEHYVSDTVDQWCRELNLLSEIAKIEPHAAYSGFVSGYKHKMNYVMRTIPGIGHLMKRVDDVILNKLIPAITDGIVINQHERKLLSIPVKYGGLGIPLFAETSTIEYDNSITITENLTARIAQQEHQYLRDTELSKKKNAIKTKKRERIEKVLEDLRKNLRPEQIRLIDINQETGASSWLTTIPLKEEGYMFNKQSFWDLIRLRYGWSLKRLPETCECGTNFTTDHALSCKKGGFITLRHNIIRNITATLLREVCHDVRIEPQLQPLSGESFQEATSNKADEARVDVCARGFWATGQMAFFDVRVFNPTARRYINQKLSKTYEINEKEKKKHYNERVLQVEHGSFTPLVMSATGGMGRECRKFYARLAENLSEKRKQNHSLTASWLRRKICFALMNSVCMCLRGSRSVFPSRLEDSLSVDLTVSEITSRVQ